MSTTARYFVPRGMLRVCDRDRAIAAAVARGVPIDQVASEHGLHHTRIRRIVIRVAEATQEASYVPPKPEACLPPGYYLHRRGGRLQLRRATDDTNRTIAIGNFDTMREAITAAQKDAGSR